MVTGLMALKPSPREEIKCLILSDTEQHTAVRFISYGLDFGQVGAAMLLPSLWIAPRARGTRGTAGGHTPPPEEHLSLSKKALPTGGVTPSTAGNIQRRCELRLSRMVKCET